MARKLYLAAMLIFAGFPGFAQSDETEEILPEQTLKEGESSAKDILREAREKRSLREEQGRPREGASPRQEAEFAAYLQDDGAAFKAFSDALYELLRGRYKSQWFGLSSDDGLVREVTFHPFGNGKELPGKGYIRIVEPQCCLLRNSRWMLAVQVTDHLSGGHFYSLDIYGFRPNDPPKVEDRIAREADRAMRKLSVVLDGYLERTGR